MTSVYYNKKINAKSAYTKAENEIRAATKLLNSKIPINSIKNLKTKNIFPKSNTSKNKV